MDSLTDQQRRKSAKNIPISPEIIAGVALAAVWHQNPSGYRRKWPPVNIVLSPGQAHESQFAQRLLDNIGIQRQTGSMKRRGHAVLADKAYSGHALRYELKNKGIKAVIPRKSNEKWRRMVVHSSIALFTASAMLLNDVLAA